MAKVITCFKAVRLDGRSHYDGKTLWVPGSVVEELDAPMNGEQCGRGIHGCKTLLDAVAMQSDIPRPHCASGGASVYLRFTADPADLCGRSESKLRFRRVIVGEFLSPEETDEIAGFKLWEVNHPVNPLILDRDTSLDLQALLEQWASVRDSVRDSVRASVRDSVWVSVWASVRDSVRDSVRASVRDSVRDSVWDSVWASVWASVRDSVRDSVWDSVWAYIGGLFPGVTTWKYAESLGPDPWRPLLTLWYGGYVPSFDGTTWRLHAGPKAEIVHEWRQGKA